jgi:hypothetical protein
MKFDGVWYITEMENWDEDYFNMGDVIGGVAAKVRATSGAKFDNRQ